jgi:hypothetical protein
MNLLKKIVPVLVVFTSLSFGFPVSTTPDCAILHEGTFKYGDIGEEIIVKIKEKEHIELHNKGKYFIKSEIIWVSDCEYNMTMKEITIPDFPYGPGDVMNVKVDKITGKEIYYTSAVKGESWKGKLIKIK